MTMTRDFWKSAGLHLLERRADAWLGVTPQFLRAYYTRPEVHPVETSCAAEIKLHEDLLHVPELRVDEQRLRTLADPDAVETYRIVLRFRDLLLKAGTIEGAYHMLAREGAASVPPVFLDQMVHVILRAALEGTSDPIRLRAAELFFREQSVSIDDGRLMMADEEIVEMHAAVGRDSGLGQLLASSGTPMRQVTLDVLEEANKQIYWDRSDRFDTVVDFRFGQPALDAFARVVEIWLRHMLHLDVRVQPLREIVDPAWRWHIGLDREATAILNALYEGHALPEQDAVRIAALLRLDIVDSARVQPALRGVPIYLGLAMTPARKLRMKPQNLLVNLPLLPAG